MKNQEISYNTKKILSNTLKALMARKNFNKISISEITRLANYNRKTFYYHFDSIDDLLMWTLEHDAMAILSEYENKNDYKNAILFAMAYIEDNQEVLSSAYNSQGKDVLRQVFYKDFYKLSSNVIEKILLEESLEIDDNYKDIMCRMLAGATATMIIDYFSKQKEEYAVLDKELVVDDIIIIASASVRASIEAYKNK